MSTVSTCKMTSDQFLQLGEDPPGVRLELVNGEIAVSPGPIPNHSYIEKKLTIILGHHVYDHKLGRLYGDVDTIFGYHDVRRPDLIYFAKDRVHLIAKKAMEGPLLSDLHQNIIRQSDASIRNKCGVSQACPRIMRSSDGLFLLHRPR